MPNRDASRGSGTQTGLGSGHTPIRNHGVHHRSVDCQGSLTTLIGEEMIKIARDPVCVMDVDKKAAAATSEYEGKSCYLCAPGCKRAFDAAPEKYRAAS